MSNVLLLDILELFSLSLELFSSRDKVLLVSGELGLVLFFELFDSGELFRDFRSFFAEV